MVLIHLSSANLEGIGLTLSGFDANRQLRTYQTINLKRFPRSRFSLSWMQDFAMAIQST
jgi:hypothetical protein